MKSDITLAESATTHPDGTLSMLRAGIANVQGRKPPFTLNAALVVRITGDESDKGEHRTEIKGVNESGAEFMPAIKGQFSVPPGGGTSGIILNFQAAFEQPGRYTFKLAVDEVEIDSLTITVSQLPAATGATS